MKAKNPGFNNPIDAKVTANQGAVIAFVNSSNSKEFVTFDEIRANDPGNADLTDGLIDTILRRNGTEVRA